MPIKPENRAKYPDNWQEIRARILARAGDRCEQCGVENGAIGVRAADGRLLALDADDREVDDLLAEGVKTVRIVLTIAHVHNPDPSDVRDENLAAWCQRCHNRHDAPMRAKNAAETRRQRRLRTQPELIEVAP